MKIKFDCPLNFLDEEKINKLFDEYELIDDQQDPDVLVVNPGTSFFLDRTYFTKFNNLKIVATPSTGTNHIDVNFLRERGVKVFCLLDDKSSLNQIHASAEFTWIHIMNLQRKFTKAISSLDQWRSDENEARLRSNELFGKKIGIIGMGRIGNKVANYANAFGMDVYFFDPYVDFSHHKAIKLLDIKEIEDCDVISINCALTHETKNLITFGLWDNIKTDAVIVNTSRGEVVDENYIADLIKNKNIKYGADVLQYEQDVDRLKKSPIYNLSKQNGDVVLTPHVAGATNESQTKALLSVLSLCKDFYHLQH